MKKGVISSILFLFLLGGCASYVPDQRVWDLPYPSKTIALDVIDKTGMGQEEMREFTSTLTQVLGGKNIHIDARAKARLTVDVIAYQRQSGFVSTLRFVGEKATAIPFQHYSSNVVDLRARLTTSDGKTTEFTKLEEIQESSLEFKHLLESMLRRIASSVFMADGLFPTSG